MGHAETSISGRTDPDYEQLTMQIKKILDAQPKYLCLGLDHAVFFFLCVFVKLRKGTSKCQLLGSVRSCVNTCFLWRKNSATVIRSLKIKYLQNSPLLLFNWEKNSDLQEHTSATLIRLWCLQAICLGCFCASLKQFFPKYSGGIG